MKHILRNKLFGLLTIASCLYVACSPSGLHQRSESNIHLQLLSTAVDSCSLEWVNPLQEYAQCKTWSHDRAYTILSLFQHSSIEQLVSEYLALQMEVLSICDNSFKNQCEDTFDDNLNTWLTQVSKNLEFDYTSYCTDELVAIDVGHAPTRYGATSSQGKKEYDYNFNLARQVQEELRRRQIRSVVLRYDAEVGTFSHRRLALKKSGATLFLSIHHDSVQSHYLSEWSFQGTTQHYSDKFSGFSLFVSAESTTFEQNKQLANAIGQNLATVSHPTHHHAEAIKGENRTLLYPQTGVYQFDKLGILRGNKIPSVLIEAGVLVNRNEERQLADPLYQLFLASNIASGINQYCQMSTTESF